MTLERERCPLCGHEVRDIREKDYKYWCDDCQHGWSFTVFWQLSRVRLAGWSEERIRTAILDEDKRKGQFQYKRTHLAVVEQKEEPDEPTT